MTSTQTDLYDITSAVGIPGQYQIAYSKRLGKLFVTGTAGNPALVSTIARVDPETLEVEATADLPVIVHDKVSEDGTSFTSGNIRLAVHGIAVDDEHGNVWVSNAFSDQVSVYDQDTLALVWTTYHRNISIRTESETETTPWGHQQTYPAGTTRVAPAVNHPRSVLIDPVLGRAYVTAIGGAVSVAVYDTETFEKVGEIVTGAAGNAAGMNIVRDTTDGALYHVELSAKSDEGEIFQAERNYIHRSDPETLQVTDRIPLPEAIAATGLAIDPEAREIYVAGQHGGDNGLLAYNLDTQEQKFALRTGGNPLAVVVDPALRRLYVGDFKDGTVTVIDANEGTILETIDIAKERVNHLTVADGVVYVVDKAKGNPDYKASYRLDYETGEVDPDAKNADGSTPELAADTITRLAPR